MSIKTKLKISMIAIPIVLVVLPLISLVVTDPINSTAFLIVLLMLINSFTAIGLGLMVGKDIRKLWWMPFAFSVLFLPCYLLILNAPVTDLLVYALFYLALGVLTMFVSCFLFPKKEQKKYLR